MKKRKKGVSLFLAICMLFCAAAAPASAASYKISFTSKSDAVYFVNYDTQTVMYEQNAQKQTNPGALTAVMTAMVTLEYCEKNSIPLETEVTAQSYLFDEFAGLGVTTADVRSGETVRIIDLLYALMLQSACEAANILADYVGGGLISTFIDMMNAKAKQLGAEHTVFTNPHGLHDPNQVTTAYDQYLIVSAAMQNETFRAVVSSKSFTENGRSFTNHNKLLWRVDGADGIKTGYTKRAGRILAGSAVRDGRRLVCVTICDPDDWRDQQALFDYGFSAFSLQTLVREGDTVGSVPVVGGRLERVSLTAAEEISYPLAEGERTELVLHAPQLAFAPVLAGQAGWLELRVDGVCVREVPVYYAQAVEETRPARSFWKRMFGG